MCLDAVCLRTSSCEACARAVCKMATKIALLCLLAAIYCAMPSTAASCNIAGNWTSSKSATDAVHIEIHQDASNKIAVRATPWQGKTGFGTVRDHEVSLVMIGATHPEKGTITKSPHKSPEGTEAPDCTYLPFGWCKFPYCPFPEPQWKPWPKPDPTPGRLLPPRLRLQLRHPGPSPVPSPRPVLLLTGKLNTL